MGVTGSPANQYARALHPGLAARKRRGRARRCEAASRTLMGAAEATAAKAIAAATTRCAMRWNAMAGAGAWEGESMGHFQGAQGASHALDKESYR